MAFYAGAPLQAGDVMEVEFQTPHQVRVKGIVRSRAGYCFGVEFMTRMANGSIAPQLPESSVSRPHVQAWPTTPEPEVEESTGFVEYKRTASYADVCAELARAEDRLAIRLQRNLEAEVDQNSPQFKRLCLNLLKVRELRQKIEALIKAN